tara:strand:- start:1569 stop:1757 length:189 start_codon:yes stop_codon:yes gene_type:complete
MNLNENRGRKLYSSKSGDFAFRFAQQVMKKIGEFKHPELKKVSDYEKCICYGINKNVWQNLA